MKNIVLWEETAGEKGYKKYRHEDWEDFSLMEFTSVLGVTLAAVGAFFINIDWEQSMGTAIGGIIIMFINFLP